MNKKPLNISFWVKEDSGNALTHSAGLTPDQVEALRQIIQDHDDGKPVRLIMFRNDRKGDTSPSHSLKVFGGGKSAPARHDDGGL